MKIGIMQPYFFPYIGYFQLIKEVDVYVNLDHVSFMKRSYMTRNTLKNNTPINLVLTNASQNRKCNEVMVNFENNYISKFKKTIHHLYSKSPNFEEINSLIIDPVFIDQKISVSKFNIELIKNICVFLDIKTKIIDTSFGLTELKKGEGLKEITKKLKGDVYVNAIGGQSLYDKIDFKKDGITLFFIKMGDVSLNNKYSSILDLLYTYEKNHIKEQIEKYTLI